MDALDLRLLQRMYPRALPSGRWEPGLTRATELAAALGVTGETARGRLARLRQAGILEGVEARPSLRHLGLDWSAYLYDLPLARKCADLARLEGVDGVAGYLTFVGETAMLVLAHVDETDRLRKLALVEKLVGARPRARLARPPFPPAPRALTPLDWRILRALRKDADRGATQIAREVGVTPRTARDRLARLVAETSVALLPVLDRGRVEGVFSHLVLHPREGASDGLFGDVLDLTRDHRLYAWPPATGLAFDVGLVTPSAAQAEALRQQAASLAEVEAAELLVTSGGYDHREMIDDLVARRAA